MALFSGGALHGIWQAHRRGTARGARFRRRAGVAGGAQNVQARHGLQGVGREGHCLQEKYVSDLPKDAAFAARASRVYPALRAMYAKIGGADVGEADTLLWSTYVHLRCECEQSPDRLLPGGRKAAVSTALSAAERHAIEAEACWVWERRFQGCEEHAAFLGAQLWARLAETASGVAIFSGHDYSIPALLSHLGVRTYAPPALGYASLVLVERRADGSARVLLNPQPFRDARTGEVVTSVSAGHEVAVAEVASNGELTLLV